MQADYRTILVTFAMLLTAAPATADTYTVGPGGYSTIQAAVDAAMSGSTKNQSGNAIINVPAGTWPGATVAGPTPGAGGNMGSSYLVINGAGSGSTIIEDNSVSGSCGSLIATNGAAVLLQNTTIEGKTGVSCQSAIFAQNNAIVEIGPNVNFGPTPMQHMHAEANAIIEASQGYHVSGGAYNHWGVSTGGYVEIDPATQNITFDAPISFTHFAWAQSGGKILLGEPYSQFVNPGNVSANYKFVLRANAVLDLNGGTQSIPGTYAQKCSGAQYVNGPPAGETCP